MESEDELKAENNLLKLKLELEHGMQMMDTSALDPEVENQWLTDIYEFENSHKEVEQIPLYDFLGRPDFKPFNELHKEEVSAEYDRLDKLMLENHICLDCLCDYEDDVLYKFITEEFFQKKIDNIRMKEMFHHFIYEEYHPNHDYDLRRYSTEFIEKILTGIWTPEWDESELNSSVLFRGKSFDKKAISKFILTWQECFHPIVLDELTIAHVEFDLEKGVGSVRIQLNYTSEPGQGKVLIYSGKSFISFKRTEWGYWCISSFQMPGFGD